MSEANVLVAHAKEKAGKGVARSLRREGFVPCVVYGGEKDQLMLSVSKKDINGLCTREDFYNSIVEISVDGKPSFVVLPKDIQFHPVTGDPLHLDFLRVTRGSRVKIRVPIEFINADKSPAIKLGGVLNTVMTSIELLCSPVAIPKKFEIDLSGVGFGKSFLVGDLEIPEECQLPHSLNKESVVATIVQPQRGGVEDIETAEGSSGDASSPSAS